MIIRVPERFQPPQKRPYPSQNYVIFEDWFFRNCKEEKSRALLPVLWTNFYVSNQYGRDETALDDLQNFLNGLDQNKPMYTIVQYDDFIINSTAHLDLKVFAPCGKPDVTIPLMCMPQPYEYHNITKRDLFCNFVGRLTHTLRSDIKYLDALTGYYISNEHHHPRKYYEVLRRSVFTLCIRGYGSNSFRTLESLQYGSIPVYLSDKFDIPFGIDFEEYGVLIKAEDVSRVDEILRKIPQKEIEAKQRAIPKIFKEHYTYEGCKKQILKRLND